MGMRKSFALMAMMAMAMSADGMGITERGRVGNGRQPKLPQRKKPLDFNKQEGVLNMINDYKLIIKNESKKGLKKQLRIKNKINKWLQDGFLKENDLH
jgi:hypothetical protein